VYLHPACLANLSPRGKIDDARAAGRAPLWKVPRAMSVSPRRQMVRLEREWQARSRQPCAPLLSCARVVCTRGGA
jgi:hypothetical protein